jgi:hypothetical protein
MVRHRIHQTITLGRFGDGIKWASDMNEVARNNGWAQWRVIVPFSGPRNHMILESEYPDFATMHSESDALYSNPEGMAVFRRSHELVAVGTHPWDEVEEEAPLELA